VLAAFTIHVSIYGGTIFADNVQQAMRLANARLSANAISSRKSLMSPSAVLFRGWPSLALIKGSIK
jgi:hypothetical protein